MSKVESQELIICECMEELSITETTTCPKCRRSVLTTKELKELKFQIDSQICALKVQSHEIAIELSLRTMRRPSRPYLIEQDFYKGLRGKANPVVKRERDRQAMQAEAMTLLEMV